ncbi:MAG: LacI family DNA-binding transcriptional regulator [Clostridia bacterium]|nr:LacI family DNA-binding transcriptional regulator [Clostridia bacterium]
MTANKKHVTIRDVAERAGVSVSTASNAINNKGYVSESTKQVVLKAVEELNYRPSAIARSLKKQQSGIIGFFAYDMSGPVHSEIVSGVVRKAEEHGYETVVCNSHSRKDRILSNLLSSRLFDACIVMSPDLEDDFLLDLAKNLFPVVALDRDIEDANIGCVLMDNATSGHDIARLFSERGMKRIAFIGPNPDSRSFHDVEDRTRGFLNGVKQYQLDLPAERYRFGWFTMDSGYQCMTDLLKLDVLPEALFAANDEMAQGAIRAIIEHGLRVPDDIGVIGFDDIAMSSFVTPSLSTVRRPSFSLGSTAVELLLSIMRYRQYPQRLILPTEIVLRESFR